MFCEKEEDYGLGILISALEDYEDYLSGSC